MADKSDALWDLSIGSLKRDAQLRKRLQVIFLIGGTALASGLQLVARMASDGPVAILNGTSLALSVVIVVVAALLAWADRNGPEALAEAHAANEARAVVERELADVHVQKASVENTARALALLNSVGFAMRELVGSALINGSMRSDSRAALLGQMLDLILAQKAELMGIADERWSLAIYVPAGSNGGTELRCICCRRRDRADEETEHRQWPVGHGHVGRCFQSRNEVVADDTHDQKLQAYFSTPEDLSRPDDADRYRSIAAVPICIAGQLPIGVVIATTDVAGRFLPAGLVNGRDPVEPLRILAAHLAIVMGSRPRGRRRKGGEDEQH